MTRASVAAGTGEPGQLAHGRRGDPCLGQPAHPQQVGQVDLAGAGAPAGNLSFVNHSGHIAMESHIAG